MADDTKKSDAANFFSFVVYMFLVVFAISGSINGYDAADRSGWIRHTATTDVTIDGNWMVGEVRSCSMVYWKAGDISSLDCRIDQDVTGVLTERDIHRLHAAYWGRIRREDKGVFGWQCERGGDSITCKAVN